MQCAYKRRQIDIPVRMLEPRCLGYAARALACDIFDDNFGNVR